MNSMVELRLESIRIAASLRDVSSECVIDIAAKITRYIKGDAVLPESVSMEDFVKSITENTFAKIGEKEKKLYPSTFDEEEGVCGIVL